MERTPLRKGERTRQRAVARAAEVFSLYGYAGTSMSQLRAATGLTGGVYGHFESKEALALEAFDYAMAAIRQRTDAAIADKQGPMPRLHAIIGVFRNLIDEPFLPGGCPILNTAIEADDAYPPLRDRARAAMTLWHSVIARIVCDGIERGDLRSDTDPAVVATILTATLEGAIMLAKLYSDPTHMYRAVDHLTAYVSTLAAEAVSLDASGGRLHGATTEEEVIS